MMDILKELTEILYNLPFVNESILFGSRNSVKYREDSDYDLCIIIKESKYLDTTIQILTNYMLKKSILIHPYIFTEAEALKKKEMPIYSENIFKNGKVLFKKCDTAK